MDLREAFYKQKDELHAAQRQIKKLRKQFDSGMKNLASNEIFQKQLNRIQGLNNQLSRQTAVSNRYREMYETQKRNYDTLHDRFTDLECRNRDLQWQPDCLLEKRSSDGCTAAEQAKAEIAALKDKVAKLSAMPDANGTNAGIPTSRTPVSQIKTIPNSREKSCRKIGGQPGHKKHSMSHFSEDEISDTVTHSLEKCPECSSTNLELIDEKVKDEYDYQVIVKKIRHRFLQYRCLDCGKTVQVPYNGPVADNRYGNVIQAMALSLMDLGFVSVNRTRKILCGFSPESVTLSEGYLIKLQKRYSKKLKSFVSDIKNRLRTLPLLYWDDTVVFVSTARACLRFYGNEKLALYTAHMHKNLDGINKDNILPALTDATTVMHDHNTVNYHSGFLFRNIECLQHPERDLQKIYDISHHSWAMGLKELIQGRIHERKKLMTDGVFSFSAADIISILKEADALLTKGNLECSSDSNHYFTQNERALLARIEAYKANYFEWIRDFSLPVTNNLSERSLRFIKTRDKVSGQFQSIEYASYFADIRTYLETCSRNGINEFSALLRLTGGISYTLDELLGGD